MTDAEIKALVRKRDGYKCRDCGMTNEQHFSEYGKALDVHRLIPGADYDEDFCVTLCRACHGKKPKTLENAYWNDREASGIVFFHLILYHDAHKRVFNALKEVAEKRGVTVGVVLEQVLTEFADGVVHDYCI